MEIRSAVSGAVLEEGRDGPCDHVNFVWNPGEGMGEVLYLWCM